ncbi:acyl-protein thioesterase 1 [Crepidotus variabilis]|uniref:Acyl-protein thioesterase 1 n=1 Tax=Crepidotus variabilis TaxID=179855 RepID=A0A9P6JR47_9AGAR|nr:acyl-protein thioesterase 1 [Crepidotus variabilis]
MDYAKIVFPDAPMAPLTANKGYSMHTWFDLTSYDSIKRHEDKPSLSLAVSRLSTLIAQEHSTHNIPFERIIIGGFSQGAALSVLTRLTTLQGRIGGVFIISSYLPLREEVLSKDILGPHTANLPIFWGHGTTDPQVPHDYWKSIAQQLATTIEVPFLDSPGDRNEVRLTKEDIERDGLGGLRFLSYPDLGHWLSEEVLNDLNVWIGAVLER